MTRSGFSVLHKSVRLSEEGLIKLALLLLTVVLFASLQPAVAEHDPPEIKALVPTKWELECYAYGDLGNGSQKDAALTVALKPQHAFGDAENRQLIIAIRKDGKLKKTADGFKCMPLGTGPSGGDPTVTIENHSALVEVFGGSREKFTTRYQYKKIGDRWPLIGYREQAIDSNSDTNPLSIVDINLLTGKVESNLTAEGKAAKHDDFYELFSVLSRGRKNEQPTPQALKLNRRENLSAGAQLWKGAEDCSASITSTHSNTDITIVADVTDNQMSPQDKVWLADQAGKILRPTRNVRSLTTHGYMQTMVFALGAPAADQIDDGGSNQLRRWTINVDDADAGRDGIVRLSSKLPASVSGRGGILLINSSAMPTIETLDIRDRNFQSRPIPLPE